jgi:hypothetical protein
LIGVLRRELGRGLKLGRFSNGRNGGTLKRRMKEYLYPRSPI